MDMAKLTSDLSSVNPVILVCTALVCCVAFVYVRSRPGRLSSSQLPRSPLRLPIIGNLHQLGASAHQSLHTLSLEHGPLMLMYFGSVPTYVVSSGELARQVMKTCEAEFPARLMTEASRILFEGGEDLLFNPAGTRTTLARKVCVSGVLSPKRVQALQFIREEEVASLVTKLRRLVNNDRRAPVNLSDLFLTLASTTLSRAVLGLKSTDESNHVMGQLAKQAGDLLGKVTAVGDYIPALSWVDRLRGLTRETKRVSQAVHEFLDRVIDEHIEKQNDDDDDRKYFVDILLELQAKKDVIGGHELTRKEIRAVLLILFIAGIDSSATALESTMKEIVKNPRIMRKLQQEIRGVVGKKSNIHQSDLNQMEYLKCVVKETLRLDGPTLVARLASEDVDVGGFRIPAKGVALVNLWAIHRDPDTWDRPLEFLPERFLDACYDYTGQDQKYFPFGLGRRICPGVQFAMFGIEYTLANVLCWFDWELPDGMSARDFDMSAGYGKVPLHLVPVPPSQGR